MYSAALPRPESQVEGLGSIWHLNDITHKPWPGYRFMHHSMTALDRLFKEHQPEPQDIESVVMSTVQLANSAHFRNPNPSMFCDYSFSYQHSVAIMALSILPRYHLFDSQAAGSNEALDLLKRLRIELFY